LDKYFHLFKGELKYALFTVYRVKSATAIPANPKRRIGDAGIS